MTPRWRGALQVPTINRANNKSISFEGIDNPTKEYALKHFMGITLHLHQSKSFRIRYKSGCFIHFANSSNDMNPIQNFETWNRSVQNSSEFALACVFQIYRYLITSTGKHGENIVKNNINSV